MSGLGEGDQLRTTKDLQYELLLPHELDQCEEARFILEVRQVYDTAGQCLCGLILSNKRIDFGP